MQQNIALLWIRDGVLIERMHINAIAFALTYYTFVLPETQAQISLSKLINYAFLKSGYSCFDKIKFFNKDSGINLIDIDIATKYYNSLASAAGKHAQYFPGIIDLLHDLSNNSIKNFITSAISQNVLDTWAMSQQGKLSSKYITQILGSKENFSKGYDHFNFIKEKYRIDKIIYVADAESEIATGNLYARQFNITPVGFANVITTDKIITDLKNVFELTKSLQAIPPYPLTTLPKLKADDILLPDKDELIKALYDNGAKVVVSADATNSIVDNLKAYLVKSEIL